MAEYDSKTRSALRLLVWTEIALFSGLLALVSGTYLRKGLDDGFPVESIVGSASCAFVAAVLLLFGGLVMPWMSALPNSAIRPWIRKGLPWIALASTALCFASGAAATSGSPGDLPRALAIVMGIVFAMGAAPFVIWVSYWLGAMRRT